MQLVAKYWHRSGADKIKSGGYKRLAPGFKSLIFAGSIRLKFVLSWLQLVAQNLLNIDTSFNIIRTNRGANFTPNTFLWTYYSLVEWSIRIYLLYDRKITLLKFARACSEFRTQCTLWYTTYPYEHENCACQRVRRKPRII